MNRFLKRTVQPVSPVLLKVSSKQGDIFTSFRAEECRSSLNKSGGKPFCKSYNVVIDHHQKLVIKRHIDSKV